MRGGRLHHIFDNLDHKMGSFLTKYGDDQEKAYFAIQDAAYEKALGMEASEMKSFTRVTVDGEDVDVTWMTINGKFMLVDASRRDVLP